MIDMGVLNFDMLLDPNTASSGTCGEAQAKTDEDGAAGAQLGRLFAVV